ncbi:aldehyde dehydrogenase family protein [Sphaerimonospora cavernae]|uniref:Aldehyde dehydrogenase family protein n=1 Tax=Sphaerimonospora cavernae TaxID=1740611 RepID=A0ABV6U3C0_9ACTN
MMNPGNEVFERHCHWIGGTWTPPSRPGELLPVVNPATEEEIGRVPAGDAMDVGRAVDAASQALPAWRDTPVEDRLTLLERFCDVLDDNRAELADIITAEVGAPVSISGPMHVGLTSEILRAFVEIGREFDFVVPVGGSTLIHEPVGVAGCITPWNLPLILIAQKLGAAVVSGCTTVLKPSELTPFSALRLAEYMTEAGYPPGVFNVVTGDGPAAGEALVSHPMVRKVSFTGSTRAGRRVAALAAESVKRVSLELGGKSANLVLPDADLERAVVTGSHQACFNAGQSCIAWSRLIVPADRLADATEIAARAIGSMKVGDPTDPTTDVGPLVSAEAADRVRGYIAKGVGEGAHLALGGSGRPSGLPRGFYVEPTVLTNVQPDMIVAQEEIFGPVLCVIPYRTEEEAIAIANSTPYGLHGAVWSQDEDRAMAVARRLETGMVNINGYGFDPMAPFGGYKQSGVGRELGTAGLQEFLEVKAVQRFQQS